MQDPPAPTGNVENITLTGCLAPFTKQDQPAWLSVTDSPDLYLPVFTTEELLRETMERAGNSYHKIVRIVDHDGFLASIPMRSPVINDSIKIGLDFRILENGRVCWKEVNR